MHSSSYVSKRVKLFVKNAIQNQTQDGVGRRSRSGAPRKKTTCDVIIFYYNTDRVPNQMYVIQKIK